MDKKTTANRETEGSPPPVTKSRRVRTGCLTCRERHLKCDEAAPDCLNCRKSNRRCKRGIRLSFQDAQVYDPRYQPSTRDWAVHFQDESRMIASEYRGGLKLYAKGERPKPAKSENDLDMLLRRLDGPPDFWGERMGVPQYMNGGEYSVAISEAGPIHSHVERVQYAYDAEAFGKGFQRQEELPSAAPPSSTRSTTLYGFAQSDQRRPAKAEAQHNYGMSEVSSATSIAPLINPPPTRQATSEKPPLDDTATSPNEKTQNGERDFLGSIDELHYMQVFVEEVGVWMDSFDRDRHFSEIIPYRALKSPMLLNAFLACGVKHLSLASPEKAAMALVYYNTATTKLLRNVQNPDRDMAECATAAVVLNVYDIMSSHPAHGGSHGAGARALIRDCGWNAKSTGVGAACFWLNIVMEVLSCLEMNRPMTWEPDGWGLDMDLTSEPDGNDEQVWGHRIFYIVARIANFCASMPGFHEQSLRSEQIKLHTLSEWQELKRLCDEWNNACPRTMHPMGYLHPTQSKTKSLFPRIWLIKRAAELGRLFYHTALCLLAQTHPLEPAASSEEMRILQLHHAHQVCGIVAHSSDKGIASAAIRALAIAAPALVDHGERVEALDVLKRISTRSGWRLGEVEMEVKKAWEWSENAHQEQFQGPGNEGMGSMLDVTAPNAAGGSAMNPLSSADFSLPDHPYRNWYEPPNRSAAFNEAFF